MAIGAQDWSRSAIGWFCNLCTSHFVEGDPGEGAVTETMYTVPSGKTLYLTGCAFSISNNLGAVSYGELKVTDGDDVGKYYLLDLRIEDQHENFITRSFPLPIKIISGWKIKLLSGQADVLVGGYINGFLI